MTYQEVENVRKAYLKRLAIQCLVVVAIIISIVSILVQNNAIYEEIDSEPTSQGYKTYIFKWDDLDEYDVYIDLNNLTIDENGFDENYKYFKGTFQTLDEAKVFVDTFKINEDATK